MKHISQAILLSGLILAGQSVRADTYNVDVWADNWFAMYVNGTEVLEDSVPITTERSFNAESGTFSVDGPAQIAIITKDFKENDTGLEYIGSRRQQMGDGGLIFQIKDSAGMTALVSSSAVKCLVMHYAPIDTSCEGEANPVEGQGVCASETQAEPDGWMLAGFDDAAWPAATEHTEQAVDPKFGYDEITWDPSAQLIWGDDLERDNTLICRVTLGE